MVILQDTNFRIVFTCKFDLNIGLHVTILKALDLQDSRNAKKIINNECGYMGYMPQRWGTE